MCSYVFGMASTLKRPFDLEKRSLFLGAMWKFFFGAILEVNVSNSFLMIARD